MTSQIGHIDLVSPGTAGLNLQQKGSILPPIWATMAHNCVLDDAGRLAARNGYSITTSTPITGTPNVETIFEYVQGDGVVEPIVAWDGGIANSLTDPEGNDISGVVVDTDGTWNFQNFNEKVIGFQDGQIPIVRPAASNFAAVVAGSGTAPTISNGVGMCAYGRVWGLDSDGQTIKYSGLLDETDWGGTTAGSIDMSAVWTGGMDTVTAIAAFNGSLVVFGQNHIVIWDDSTGSQLGLSPTQLVVVDVIQGTGCVAQQTIQHIGESDLVFLSRNGLQSLGRVIQEKSNPLANVSKYVRDEFVADVALSSLENIKTTYYPEDGWYLISLPDEQISWVFDVKNRFRDEEGEVVFPATQWDLAPVSLYTRRDGTLLFGGAGEIWTYGADSDNGNLIDFKYASPWLDLGEDVANRLKMLKRLGSILFVRNNAAIKFAWAVDFQQQRNYASTEIVDPSVAEWNLAEWGLAEWSGGLFLNIIKVPARGRGQYYKIFLESGVTGQFALQQMELLTKMGRLA